MATALDLSVCDYYRGLGTCTAWSCHVEPECITGEPLEGWRARRLARIFCWAFDVHVPDEDAEAEASVHEAIVRGVLAAQS